MADGRNLRPKLRSGFARWGPAGRLGICLAMALAVGACTSKTETTYDTDGGHTDTDTTYFGDVEISHTTNGYDKNGNYSAIKSGKSPANAPDHDEGDVSGKGTGQGSGQSSQSSSDIRLKRDIVEIGRLENGLHLYRFRYKWGDQEYVGVMAQEVGRIVPGAVSRGADGYLRVDYGKLGLRLETWDEWLRPHKMQALGAKAN